jgi:membrane protein
MFEEFQQKFDDLVWGDILQKHGMLGRVLANTLRFGYALIRDIITGQLTLRAMSLVYTTLLSIVPLIAFSFSVLKGFGIHNQLEPILFSFLEPLGDQGAEITRKVIELVDNVQGGVLGGVSLALFVYTAISMVQKIEESFNYVWNVSKARGLARRVMEYLVVLLIGSIVAVIAISMLATLSSTAVVQYLTQSDTLGPVLIASGKLTPYLLVSGVFAFLYIFMPNTHVRVVPALVGGLAGGFMWASMGMIFTTFVVASSRTALIYSGFAIAITTLMWLYMNWLVLLIGAQLAYYVQNPEYRRIGRREPQLSNSMRERLALNIMYYVGDAFRKAEQTVTVSTLSSFLKIPSITLAPIVAALQKNAVLTATENDVLIPGREMSRIRLVDILAVVRLDGETGSYRDPKWATEIDGLGGQLDQAIAATVGDRTLSDLLDESESEANGEAN